MKYLSMDGLSHLWSKIKEKLNDMQMHSSEIVLSADNWSLDGSEYVYIVEDAKITNKTKVDIDMDIANQKKFTGLAYTLSYNGGFKIITNKEVTEDVNASVSYQKVD